MLIGRTEANDRIADDQGRLVGIGFCLGYCFCYSLRVMPIDISDDMPAIGREALCRIIGKPFGDLPIDGDAIAVIECYELVQLPGPS